MSYWGQRVLSILFNIGSVRRPSGLLRHVFVAYGAALTSTVIYFHFVTFAQPWTLAALFLSGMYVLIFVLVRATKNSDPVRPSVVDWLCSLASLAVLFHFALSADRIVNRIPVIDELTDLDMAIGIVYVILSVEVTRRTTGLALTLIVLAFLVYNFFGHLLSGVLGHGYISLEVFLDSVVYGTYGINGAVARVAASYALLFILFGVLLTRSGGGEFFFNLAAALTGRSAGGPAKVAVISSGLYGMVSGNSVSDVVTTGSITIPIMRRFGYTGRYAASVEAAASAGGSIMPPVMGAAAFVMVEYTGISYGEIIFAAIGPAMLYYLAIFYQVHFSAQRRNIAAMAADQIPSVLTALRDGGLFFVPLAVLIGAISFGYTATFGAISASLAVLVVAALRAATRIGPKELYECLAETAFRMVVITGACAAAGLVIAGLTMTGLAQKLSHLVGLMTGGHLLATLIVAAAVTLILGMGMPTVSAYILAAVLIGPLLSALDVPLLSAHMFLLYYSVMSAITPPVAVAAYAAASIAEDNPINVAVTAVRMAFIAFVVPFGFVFAPSLLLQGAVLDIVLALGSAALGVVVLAAAIEGYMFRPMPIWVRLIGFAVGSYLLVPTGTVSTVMGIAASAVVILSWRVYPPLLLRQS